MMRALYTAATGMRAEQTNVDTIANNLSNVNTTGFKGQRTEFKSLLYQTIQTRSTSGNGDAKPVGAQVGLGTRVAATTSTYTQGPLNSTERPTDFALEGDGFFAVRGADNQNYYTRNGAFTWSQYGNGQTILTDSQGNPVMDTNGNIIAVPAGVSAEKMSFGEDGAVGYMTAQGNYIGLNQRIAVYQFNNPSGLEKQSGSLLAATANSGNPMLEAGNAALKSTHNCQAAHVSNQSIVTKAGTAFSQHNIMIACLLSFFQYIFHVPGCEELAFFNINYTSCFCCFVNQIRLTAKKRRYLQNI